MKNDIHENLFVNAEAAAYMMELKLHGVELLGAVMKMLGVMATLCPGFMQPWEVLYVN
jgi:hypothetical protein